MKKEMIVTAASIAAAGLGLAGWLIFRKKRNADKNNEPYQPSHHLTDVFAKAKKQTTLESLPTFKPA